MIQARDLSFAYGPKTVYEHVNFTIPMGYKVGLVGPNGAGKSTLFSLFTKNENPSGGKVEVLGTVGFVPQEVKHDPVLENIGSIKEYLDPTFLKYDYELTQMLEGLELGFLDLNGSPKNLSGGQKTKLALARALLSEPDILLLDEPTNFMDTAGKKWVMNFLSTYPHTLIVISHDLNLLDHSIDKILEVDPVYKKIDEYRGNYSKYLLLKVAKAEHFQKNLKKEQQKVGRLEEGLKSLSGNRSAKGVRQRVIMQRRVQKAKDLLPVMPKETKIMRKLIFPEPAPVGALPLKVINISKSYGERKILENISFYIERGERIALIGQNGAGKSTLIKTLVGLHQADSGEIIRDDRLKLGYYSQEFETFDFRSTVWETVKKSGNFTDSYVRGVLSGFLFDAQKLEQDIGSLSGGEKTRLSIAMLLMQDYNFLVLDEPTTYLDVTSQRIVLEALKNYKGAMLVVSHTEEFIRELDPKRAILLPEQEIDFWSEDYLELVSDV